MPKNAGNIEEGYKEGPYKNVEAFRNSLQKIHDSISSEHSQKKINRKDLSVEDQQALQATEALLKALNEQLTKWEQQTKEIHKVVTHKTMFSKETIKLSPQKAFLAQVEVNAELLAACQTSINTYKNTILHSPDWASYLKATINDMLDYCNITSIGRFQDIKASLIREKEESLNAQAPSTSKEPEDNLETHMQNITKLGK